MKKANTAEIRDVVGALHFQGVASKEIARRLAKKQAGLPYPVTISDRQVRNYAAKYRDIHGAPPEKTATADTNVESIEAVVARLVALIGREVTAFEGKRRGSMTRERLKILADMRALLQKWRTQDDVARGKRKLNQVSVNARPDNSPPEEESTIARLAREEREATADVPLGERAVRIAAEFAPPHTPDP